MEGSHRRIERLGDPAHRRGAYLAAKQSQQRLAHLAGRQARHKAGEDHPVDLSRASRMGADDLDRAVAARPRNLQLDVAKLGQKMPTIVTVAAIGSVISPKLVEIAVNRRRHLVFDDLLQGLPAERAITLAPVQAIRLHCLHDFKCHR